MCAVFAIFLCGCLWGAFLAVVAFSQAFLSLHHLKMFSCAKIRAFSLSWVPYFWILDLGSHC